MQKQWAQILVIMAKEPVPGDVKTRLLPHLTPKEAADAYIRFLQDTLHEMESIEGIDRAVAYTPAGAREAFASLLSRRFGLFPQEGKDLGERLSNIFKDKLREGYEAVSIINSDSPDLPRARVQESFHLLQSNQAEVVFGPCDDGGYYLVGMGRAFPELFVDIPWSTDRVLSISLEKAEKMGIRVKLLPPWNDIDTYEELVAFYRKYQGKGCNGPRAGEKSLSFLSGLAQFKKL